MSKSTLADSNINSFSWQVTETSYNNGHTDSFKKDLKVHFLILGCGYNIYAYILYKNSIWELNGDLKRVFRELLKKKKLLAQINNAHCSYMLAKLNIGIVGKLYTKQDNYSNELVWWNLQVYSVHDKPCVIKAAL